jgi:hypothetical protein
MKIGLVVFFVILMSSCSITPGQRYVENYQDNSRALSSIKVLRVMDVHGFVSSLSDEKKDRFMSVIEIYEWKGGEFVGFDYRNIEWSEGEGPHSFKLDSRDTILQIEPANEFLLVRTFFGLLLKVHQTGVEVIQPGFPVASFEYVGGILHLYSKNGRGRFCDQEELKRPSAQRDPSCQLISAKLVID